MVRVGLHTDTGQDMHVSDNISNICLKITYRRSNHTQCIFRLVFLPSCFRSSGAGVDD